MLRLDDIQPLTEFQRHTRALIDKAKLSGGPLVLTANGRPEVGLQDAAAYQDLVDRLRKAEDLASIRTGLAEAEAGLGQPAGEVMDELGQKYGL